MIVAIFMRGCKWLLPAVAALYLTPTADAEPQPPTPGPPERPIAEVLATVGASLGATRGDGAWDSLVGGSAGAVWRGRRGILGVDLGLDLIGATSGRAHAVVLGGWRLGSFAVGVGLGPAARWDRVAPPDLGFAAGLWGFGGVAPYVRGGFVGDSGFVEIGLRVALPVLRRGI